ncbi:hypothetical protein GGS21DRAFT_204287 [Xylaria nigripes]|nr:hypothetical protein GGS21DRAFT_204287 [Xylaria nigripes]
MRRSKPVCLLCRLQVINATGKTVNLQWKTQAVNLHTSLSRHDVSRARATEWAPGAAASPRPTPSLRKIYFESGRNWKPGALFSPTQIPEKQSSTNLEAFFDQIVREQRGLRNTAGNESIPDDASVHLPVVGAIEKLRELIEGDTPVADAYSYFQTQVQPLAQAPDVIVPRAYQQVLLLLLDKLTKAKKADMSSEKLPTVAEISRMYVEVGKLQPRQWAVLVRELIQCIVNLGPSTEAEARPVAALRDAMLVDLVESWKVFSLPRYATSPIDNHELLSTLWFPTLNKYRLTRFTKSGKFADAFSILFEQYSLTQLGTPISTLAIATYVLLSDSTRCPAGIREKAVRFMSKVSHIIVIVDYQATCLRSEVANELPSLEQYIMGLWPDIEAHLRKNHAAEYGSSTEAYTALFSVGENRAAQVFNANYIRHRLHRVYKARNFAALDGLWQAFIGTENPMSQERIELIQQNPDLIDLFINARMSFRQPDMAVTAWGLLSEVGLKPTLMTWNLMLGGLKSIGNAEGIHNVWAKLVGSGLKLDKAIWTTRVGGLIEGGDVEGGLYALQEMAHIWETNPNAPAAVQPSIEPVNAALTALFDSGRPDVAKKLLAWAEKKDLRPDIYTFNLLLRSMIRGKNQNNDIQKLFAIMQAQGIKANEATFTIILDASFSPGQEVSAEEQAKLVAGVASAMKDSGLQLNMITYGKMIYVLLRSNAASQAMDIVTHIYERGLELSPHIYTMLVQYFFRQDPPDLNSVRLLVKRRRYIDFDDMDIVFHDRLVQGFSLTGDTVAALEVFDRVIKYGAQMSLSTLTDLLSVLLHKGLRKEARRMVMLEKTRFEKKYPNPEPHAKYWSHTFWQMAREHGLLNT